MARKATVDRPVTTGSGQPVLERLAGLETEYAIRCPESGTERRFPLYQRLVAALGQRVLTVDARHFKEGVFTANGGAVWFEAEKPASGGGLIEGATPECRGPRQLIRYQRSQDRLLGRAAEAAGFQLIKNDRDADDNVYGAQENYESLIASGWRLLVWRLGLVALLPIAILTWATVIPLLALLLTYLTLAGVFYLLAQLVIRDPRPLALNLFGSDLVEGRETGGPIPPWMEELGVWLTRLLTAPLAGGLMLLIWLTAFVPFRRRMMGFLVSRVIFAGSGMLDGKGRFHLADKAPAMNCVLGYGGLLYDRPILTLGHFLKTLCVEACLSPRDYAELFSQKQRLQIALGDSNMAETSEYLRVATTMLSLDALEAGFLDHIPAIRRPVRSLRALCKDPTLQATVTLADGRTLTAIQLQRLYLNGCRRFVHQLTEPPEECFEILALWDEVLDELEDLPHPVPLDSPLVGKLDWVSKKLLLEQAGAESEWDALKKIDIRYHELSADGYYRILVEGGMVRPLIAEEELDQSERTPPPNTPATVRGHYIREFSHSDEALSVNWKSVVLGRGRKSRVVRLSRYRPANASKVPDES